MNTSDSKNAKERLDILNNSNDGFEIANKDLKIRGQGDLFGTRQSGELYFKIGDIIENADILMIAVELSEKISNTYSKENMGDLFVDDDKQKFINKIENKIEICMDSISL